jgi:hypothetical protein
MKYESEAEGLSTLFVKRALYVPSTGEVWVGSFQGINIYDRTYDVIAPDIIDDMGSLTISGTRDINVVTSDYAGIKQLKLTLKNATWFDSWSTNSPVALFAIVSTNYENGAYQIIINATDWNDNVAGLAYDITIDNVIVGEFSKLILLITIPILAIPVILIRKRRKE